MIFDSFRTENSMTTLVMVYVHEKFRCVWLANNIWREKIAERFRRENSMIILVVIYVSGIFRWI